MIHLVLGTDSQLFSVLWSAWASTLTATHCKKKFLWPRLWEHKFHNMTPPYDLCPPCNDFLTRSTGMKFPLVEQVLNPNTKRLVTSKQICHYCAVYLACCDWLIQDPMLGKTADNFSPTADCIELSSPRKASQQGGCFLVSLKLVSQYPTFALTEFPSTKYVVTATVTAPLQFLSVWPRHTLTRGLPPLPSMHKNDAW